MYRKLTLSFFLILQSFSILCASDKSYDLFLLSGTVSEEKVGGVAQSPSLSFAPDAEDTFEGFRFRIIQFQGIPTNEEKQGLEEQGIFLLDYLPNFAYYSAIHEDVTLDPFPDPLIRNIIPVDPNFKLHPDLNGDNVPGWIINETGKYDLVVTTYSIVDQQQILADLEIFGAEILGYDRLDMATVRIEKEKLQDLMFLPYISFIEPIEHPSVVENHTGRSLHRVQLLNPVGQDGKVLDGTGVGVAVGDGGYIWSHVDFKERLTNGSSNGVSHATHVAGIIGGAGLLTTTRMGQAPGVELYSYTNHNDMSRTSTITSLHGNSGVRVTNHSLGQGCNSGYNSSARTADHQVVELGSLFHVFSAGNSGTENCGYGAGAGWGNITGGYKAGKNVITVANLTRTDGAAGSSSRGPTADGRLKPDIGAKGSSVNSTMPNDAYGSMSGTSMAAPGTAGVIATLIQGYRELNNGEDPPTGLLKGVLLNSADDLGNPGPDYIYGWGRINAYNAYNALKDKRHETKNVSQGGNKTHTIEIPEGVVKAKIMVHWVDPYASSGASKTLVNDLDMNVEGNGQTYLPWVLSNAANASSLRANATKGKDRVNNTEQVEIANPAAGTYTVNVNGHAIADGPQRYYMTYELIRDEIVVTFPSPGIGFPPGTGQYIRWDTPGNSGSFKVEASYNNGNSWSTISNNVSGNIRHLSWTVPETYTYEAKIRVSRNGISGETLGTFNINEQPGNVNITAQCDEFFTVSWSAAPTATAYQVFYSNKSKWVPMVSTTNTSLSVAANGNENGYVTVSVLNPDGTYGRVAGGVKKTTQRFGDCSGEPEIPVPMNLTAKAESDSLVVLNWTYTSNADNIEIERSVNGGEFEVIGSVNGNQTTFEDATINNFSQYVYRVRAQVGQDYSEYSNEATVEWETPQLSLFIVNADNGDSVQQVFGNEFLYLSKLPDNISMELKSSAPLGSVSFELTGGTEDYNYIDNDMPYYIAGGDGGSITPWVPEEGDFILKVVATSEADAAGDTINKIEFPISFRLEETFYDITATSGENGSIDPEGVITLLEGSTQKFEILPDEGFKLKEIRVDGTEIDSTLEYTFESLADNHTIEVEFDSIPVPQVRVFLVSADTQMDIEEIFDGFELNRTLLNENLNIRVEYDSTFASIKMQLSGVEEISRTENVAPFVVFGEDGNGFLAWAPQLGDYKLEAEAYSETFGRGVLLRKKTVNFTVIDEVSSSSEQEISSMDDLSSDDDVDPSLSSDGGSSSSTTISNIHHDQYSDVIVNKEGVAVCNSDKCVTHIYDLHGELLTTYDVKKGETIVHSLKGYDRVLLIKSGNYSTIRYELP